jgi:hypothetical protein
MFSLYRDILIARFYLKEDDKELKKISGFMEKAY